MRNVVGHVDAVSMLFNNVPLASAVVFVDKLCAASSEFTVVLGGKLFVSIFF